MNQKSISRPALVGVVAVVSLSVLGGYIWHEEYRPHLVEVFVFPLKSGQAIFVRTPDDHRILIGGGPNSEVLRHINSVLPFYSRRIDILIAPDTEDKNVSGLVDVLERYHVDRVYVPSVTLDNLGISTSTDLAFRAFIDLTEKQNVETIKLKSGDSIPVGTSDQVRINALFPANDELFSYSVASSPQIVLRVSYGQNTILSIGGISVKAQKYIAADRSEGASVGDVDLLIVSHGASPANMSNELISAVHPEFLVYSRVASKYATTVSKKKKLVDSLAGILLDNRFNSREVGMIKIVMDGKSLKVICTKKSG